MRSQHSPLFVAVRCTELHCLEYNEPKKNPAVKHREKETEENREENTIKTGRHTDRKESGRQTHSDRKWKYASIFNTMNKETGVKVAQRTLIR